MKLSAKNIREAIGMLHRNLKTENEDAFIVPPPHWILDSRKYKGRGRPKKSDYTFVDIPSEIRKLQAKMK